MAEDAVRQAVLAEARTWIGTPYRHQASLRGSGCDCLGLVRGVWRALYTHEPEAVPAYSATWAEAGKTETLLNAATRHMQPLAIADAMPGDLLVFRWRVHVPAKHVGIMSGPARMIHAQENACVCDVDLSDWWQRHIAGAFQFPIPR